MRIISIHAPTRGATFQFCFCFISCWFQSTLPREERQSFGKIKWQKIYFNPRSHERSDKNLFTPPSINLYFNPRSHERSDIKASATEPNFSISIHAPTRGATILTMYLWYILHISIHAPTRGATRFALIFEPVKQFQSTLPREERLDKLDELEKNNNISIHAPTRGATLTLKTF